MRTLPFAAVAPLLLLASANDAFAQQNGALKISSGSETAPLVELYTSEGCSSCPPAERWLSSAKLPGAVVLALHVDYWDSLGWPDRFAQPRFTARQQERADKQPSHSVYTPELFVAGREVRDRGAIEEILRRARATPARAQLTLALAPPDGSGHRALTVEAHGPARAALYVAVFENGLDVDVRAGENRGERLHHDFVARTFEGPIALDEKGAALLQRNIILPHTGGVAAFVEDRATGEVLQALALPLSIDTGVSAPH